MFNEVNATQCIAYGSINRNSTSSGGNPAQGRDRPSTDAVKLVVIGAAVVVILKTWALNHNV